MKRGVVAVLLDFTFFFACQGSLDATKRKKFMLIAFLVSDGCRLDSPSTLLLVDLQDGYVEYAIGCLRTLNRTCKSEIQAV